MFPIKYMKTDLLRALHTEISVEIKKKIGSGKILVSGQKIRIEKKKPDRSGFSELRSEEHSPESGNKISAFIYCHIFAHNVCVYQF